MPQRPRLIAPLLAVLTISLGGAAAGCGSSDAPSEARAPAPAAATTGPSTPATSTSPDGPASTPEAPATTTAPGDAAPSEAPSSTDTSKVVGASEVTALFKGIKQTGTTLGDPKAPVIVEYVDLQCPFCALHEREHAADIIKRLVRPGKAQLFVVPLAFLGPDSKTAQTVFLRLAKRNQALPFLHLMYLNQGQENSGYVTPAYLKTLLAAVPGATAADADPQADADITKLAGAFDGLGKAAFTKAASEGSPAGTPYFLVGAPGQDVTTLTPVKAKRGKVTVEVLEAALRKIPARKRAQVS